jgi:hypothetical protein
MLAHLIILFFVLVILYSLGSALFYLARGHRGDSARIVKALSWRIGLSLVLFILLFVAYGLGWINPHEL